MNVPATNLIAGAQYSVSLQKKAQATTDELNRQAIDLVDAAATPKVTEGQKVGTRLNIKA